MSGGGLPRLPSSQRPTWVVDHNAVGLFNEFINENPFVLLGSGRWFWVDTDKHMASDERQVSLAWNFLELSASG
jgi:hypothetical protein